MRIKICGVRRLDDALAAIDAGADYLGFNFYAESPRYISPAECARIQSVVRSRGLTITAVGIFVNAPVTFIADVLDACNLDLAQLSGDESPDVLTGLHGRAYKAVWPRSMEEAEYDAGRYAPFAARQPALLIDASHPSLYGGTGRTADWSAARHLARIYPVLLAGGLTPGNVADAIHAVEPWGVDVASGVEVAPGKKDRRKMIDFVRAARSAVAQFA
jgi:phosphoribosylanthranilate isomerase